MRSAQNPITDERTLQMLRTAFGKTITDALDDETVIEIMVNPDGKIWLDEIGAGMSCAEAKLTPEEAERVVRQTAGRRRSLDTARHQS